jgi:predicted hotdog family 3-hydroxylacyl-ACP dehydratase
LRSAGNSTPPTARIVTPDPPVNAVKNVQRIAQTTAVPPGIQPNHARNTRSIRVEAVASARMNPASVNSGMAGSVGDTLSE